MVMVISMGLAHPHVDDPLEIPQNHGVKITGGRKLLNPHTLGKCPRPEN